MSLVLWMMSPEIAVSNATLLRQMSRNPKPILAKRTMHFAVKRNRISANSSNT